MTERERLIELLKHNNCSSPMLCDPNCKYAELQRCYEERTADYLLANGVIVLPEYAKIVRCSECESLKLIGTKGKYAYCEKYGFDFLPFKADTRGHFCVQYK